MTRRIIMICCLAMTASYVMAGSGNGQQQEAGKTQGANDKALYTVADQNKVDPNTLLGWKTWRALSCARCHGAKQEGLVGPSLIESLKTLTKDQFKETVTKGRPELGMPTFGDIPRVVDNLDNLYAYLKGRSNGDIAPGHLYPIP
jgi:cytochrome c553